MGGVEKSQILLSTNTHFSKFAILTHICFVFLSFSAFVCKVELHFLKIILGHNCFSCYFWVASVL